MESDNKTGNDLDFHSIYKTIIHNQVDSSQYPKN